MMQLAPIVMGPWVELSRALGWMMVLAPMEMGKVPVRRAEASMVVVGCRVTGGLVGGSAEAEAEERVGRGGGGGIVGGGGGGGGVVVEWLRSGEEREKEKKIGLVAGGEAWR